MALPDFFDLLALGMSAGLNLEQAFFAAASQISSPPLRRLVDPLAVKFRLGVSPTQGFEWFRGQLGGGPAATTIGLLVQALGHGSPIESALREQAESLRRSHQLALERKVQTLGVRLLIPIGVFLLPALLILFFGGFSVLLRQGGGLFDW
jgi:tight adherence protein C